MKIQANLVIIRPIQNFIFSVLFEKLSHNFFVSNQDNIRFSFESWNWCFFYITTYIFKIVINNLISLKVSNSRLFFFWVNFWKIYLNSSDSNVWLFMTNQIIKNFRFFSLTITVVFFTLNLKFLDFLLIISLAIEGLTFESVELIKIFNNLIQNKNEQILNTLWQRKLLTVTQKI